MPGQTRPGLEYPLTMTPLQWRAGQLPGQTPLDAHGHAERRLAFNGGPGNCPAKRQRAQLAAIVAATPSMEGRAIARPNSMDVHRERPRRAAPSMEGRAIARPNLR